jgi:hypothetical protein
MSWLGFLGGGKRQSAKDAAACVGDPPPCPSPTRGEGTLDNDAPRQRHRERWTWIEDADDLTYEWSLAKASEWQKKASEMSNPVLKSALDAVAKDYLRMAAELKPQPAAAAQ